MTCRKLDCQRHQWHNDYSKRHTPAREENHAEQRESDTTNVIQTQKVRGKINKITSTGGQ